MGAGYEPRIARFRPHSAVRRLCSPADIRLLTALRLQQCRRRSLEDAGQHREPRAQRCAGSQCVSEYTMTSAAADSLGDGSTQSSGYFGYGHDAPFWDALSALPNLHAVVSGHDHGMEWCKRAPSSIVFCFAKHSGCV